jgi:hypothetical protein
MAAPRTTITELPEQTVVTETDELVVQNGPTTKRMTVGRLTTHGSQALTDHINDVSNAHQASSISAVPAGPPFTGADVQSQLSQGADAINQLSAAITGHLTAVTDAHDASMVSVVPVGNLASVDVQAALTELQVAIDGLPVGGGGTGITTEDAVDAVAMALQAGNNVDITYNDAANTILIDVETLTATDVGLGEVNNTSDLTKPVSAAQQAAINAGPGAYVGGVASLTGGPTTGGTPLTIGTFAFTALANRRYVISGLAQVQVNVQGDVCNLTVIGPGSVTLSNYGLSATAGQHVPLPIFGVYTSTTGGSASFTVQISASFGNGTVTAARGSVACVDAGPSV